MPFLKYPRKFEPWWKEASARAVRNSFRVATFGSTNTTDGKYTGEFKDDMRHGNGVQFYANKTVYEGDWIAGKRHGHGVFSNDCGYGSHSRIYTGMWKLDLPHGFGLMHYDDGCLYKGLFSSGYRHGFGCMYYPDGKIYMGNWVKDQRCGVGRLISSDTKNYYEGMFKGGFKCGRGRYYHNQTGQIQDGVWENGTAKVSMMWDDEKRRGVAKKRTEFPIPLLYLIGHDEVFTEAATPVFERSKICGD